MERFEDGNSLDEALAKAIGSEATKPDFEKWKQQHPEAVEMLTSRAGREKRAAGPHKIWRIIMKSTITKIAAAAVITIAVIIVVSQIGGTKGAFAKVIENVKNAESVSFMHKQKLGSQPAMVFKMYIQGKKLRGDLVAVEGQVQDVEKLQREMQQRNLPALLSYITDFTQKDGLQLDHFRKTFTRIKVDDRVASEVTKTNLIEQFRNVKPENAERIGEESHDGRNIDVYVVKDVELMGVKAKLSGKEGDRMRVWVDRGSRLPVRVLLEASFEAEGKSQDWLDFYDFTWNEPLDENLFKLAAPEGYTVAEPVVPG